MNEREFHKEILHRLHGDGGGAPARPGLLILVERRMHLHPVDAVVAAKTRILRSDDRGHDIAGDVVERDPAAIDGLPVTQRPSISIETGCACE